MREAEENNSRTQNEIKVTASNKETYQHDEVTGLFTEFPNPELLKIANEIAARNNTSVGVDDEGNTHRYPSATWKKDVFRAEEFAELDSHAVEVGVAYHTLGKD